MSKRKTERLLGLVVCLLSTKRYLTAEQVRAAVPGYPEQDDLFKRMFERDKEALRDLGVQRAELAGAAAGALLKLRAAGIDADSDDAHSPVPRGIEPRLGAPEPAF